MINLFDKWMVYGNCGCNIRFYLNINRINKGNKYWICMLTNYTQIKGKGEHMQIKVKEHKSTHEQWTPLSVFYE